MLLITYKKSGNLPMAKRYLELNSISFLSVFKYDFALDRKKPWRIWESTDKDYGFPCGEFATKREAVALAKELAEWAGIPYRKDA
jgi:hypothetical protein